jgi:hypothetical protein
LDEVTSRHPDAHGPPSLLPDSAAAGFSGLLLHGVVARTETIGFLLFGFIAELSAALRAEIDTLRRN